MHGRHFWNNDGIICAVESLEDQDAALFRDGIALLKHRWTKWTDVKGRYIENSEKLSYFSNFRSLCEL